MSGSDEAKPRSGGVNLEPNFLRITERNRHLSTGRESLRTGTRLVTGGRHPEQQFGFINPPHTPGSQAKVVQGCRSGCRLLAEPLNANGQRLLQ